MKTMALDILALVSLILLGVAAWKLWYMDQLVAVSCAFVALLMLITLGARHMVPQGLTESTAVEKTRP
jgi:uncharacterized membrane protein YqjE